MTDKIKLDKLKRYTHKELVDLDDEQDDLRYKAPKKTKKKLPIKKEEQ